MGESIGIFELLNLVKRRWYIVVIGSILGFITAFAVTTYLIDPQYSSATNLLVSRPQVGEERFQLGEIQTNIQMINTYRDVIEDAVVLEKVSAALDGQLSQDELAGKIDVIIQNDSQIFGIQVTDTSPQRAAFIANAVANTFKDSIVEIMNIEDVVILSPAVSNNQPVSPNVLFNEVIGVLAGAVFGIAIILMLTMADTRVHDESFISETLKWNRLGTITSMRKEERVSLQGQKTLDNAKKNVRVEQVESNING